MVGVLIATHGKFAEGIRDAAELIIGKQEQLDTIGLFEGNDFEEFKKNVAEKIKALDSGDGVMIFVDLFAASPYNASAFAVQELKEKMKLRLVSGVNLPMLLEVLPTREYEDDVDSLYKEAMESGKNGIAEFLEQIG